MHFGRWWLLEMMFLVDDDAIVDQTYGQWDNL